MALAANALVELQVAKQHLSVTGESEDGLIEAMINRASKLCEAHTGRRLKQVTFTNLRLTGRAWPRIPLRASPVKVTDPVTVSVDGTAQTVWKVEADGDPAGFDVRLGAYDPEGGRGPDHLYRSSGWAGTGPDNVLLTYTGGFAIVPDDVQLACLYVVQKLFRDAKRQLAEVVNVSGPFGSTSILDNAMPRVAVLLLADYEFTAGL